MSNQSPSSYTTSRDGEYTVFTIKPGQHGLAGGSSILLYAGIAMLLFCFPIGFILLGIHFFGKKSSATSEASKGSRMILGEQQPYYREVVLRVKPGLLELPSDLTHLYGRSTISSAELHRLVVKNYVLDDLGYGRIYSSNNTAFNAGRDMRLSMAKAIGWAVDAEAGGYSYILTFGLNEVTANGLMKDIHRAMS